VPQWMSCPMQVPHSWETCCRSAMQRPLRSAFAIVWKPHLYARAAKSTFHPSWPTQALPVLAASTVAFAAAEPAADAAMASAVASVMASSGSSVSVLAAPTGALAAAEPPADAAVASAVASVVASSGNSVSVLAASTGSGSAMGANSKHSQVAQVTPSPQAGSPSQDSERGSFEFAMQFKEALSSARIAQYLLAPEAQGS